jgi:NAD(P)-dependent dehydrogenase (short-subunit alcohol dehydrogenase family)
VHALAPEHRPLSPSTARESVGLLRGGSIPVGDLGSFYTGLYTCRAPESASALQELRRSHPDQLAILALDVTDAGAIEAAAAQLAQQTAALDVVINNAGVMHPGASLLELSTEQLQQSFAVNTIAPLMLAQQVLPLLERGEAPRLVNITAPTPPLSTLSRIIHPSYMASRYALNALTKMLALELTPRGIIAVALWPGYLRTDMNQMDQAARPPAETIPAVVETIARLVQLQAGRLEQW